MVDNVTMNSFAQNFFFEKRYPLVFSGPERSVRYTLFLANIHFWTPNTISNHMIWSNLPHTGGETKSLLAHGVSGFVAKT